MDTFPQETRRSKHNKKSSCDGFVILLYLFGFMQYVHLISDETISVVILRRNRCVVYSQHKSGQRNFDNEKQKIFSIYSVMHHSLKIRFEKIF